MAGTITPLRPTIESETSVNERKASRLRRVLYAIAMNPDRFASLDEQIFQLTRACQNRGEFFLPLFICNHRTGNPPVYDAAGLRAECLDLHRFRLRTLWRLVRLIKRNRIELIQWSFTQPLTNPYLWALTILVPSLTHYFIDQTSRPLPLSPPPTGIKRKIKKLLYSRYSKVFGVSQYVTDHLREHGCSSDLSTCHQFLNTDRFKPDASVRSAIREEFGADGQFIVLVVAYLVPAKGVDVAIKALARVPDGAKLWIVGGGEETAHLQELARKLGLTERIRFFGHQSNIQRFMQAADCFVCPSRWGEAAALVNLEAQASGLPTIGSNVGGNPEYILNGRTGFIFASEDDDELAQTIRLLYKDQGLRERMQREARAWAENFSYVRRMEGLLNLYRDPR
jgi:glycosyltransferase involved in cell wall biosynthesis